MMKNAKRVTTHVLVFALCLTTFFTGSSADAKAKKPKLSNKSITLTKGKTKTLKVSRTKKCKVSWKTSNKRVATVDSKGKINGVKKGTATITVKTTSGKKAVCKVTVK